jgi:hypothetical protein
MERRGLSTSEALQILLEEMHDVIEQDKLRDVKQNK